jgi:hypothetical protein
MTTGRTPLAQAFTLALLAVSSLSACGGSEEVGSQSGNAVEMKSAAPAPGERDTSPAQGTPVRITVGDTQLSAQLDDSATARDLAAQLPLTLTFRDHNNVEKTAPLPRTLSVDGAPEGHDPAGGEIGYWAPDGDLVFYYDSDAPYYNGIVRIGRFDGDANAIARQHEDFSATIDRAE